MILILGFLTGCAEATAFVDRVQQEAARQRAASSATPPAAPTLSAYRSIRDVDFRNWSYVSEESWGTTRPLPMRNGENPYGAYYSGGMDHESPGMDGQGLFGDPVALSGPFYTDVDGDGTEEALVSLVTQAYGGHNPIVGHDLYTFSLRDGEVVAELHVIPTVLDEAVSATHRGWYATMTLEHVSGRRLVFAGGAYGPRDSAAGPSRMAIASAELRGNRLVVVGRPRLVSLNDWEREARRETQPGGSR